MGKLIRIGNGFIEKEPVDISDMTLEVKIPKGYSLHYYVDLSTFGTSSGVALMKGGPKGKIIGASQVFHNTYEDSFAPSQHIDQAIDELTKYPSTSFEDYPFVEVPTEEKYEEALGAMGLNVEGGDTVYWDPRKENVPGMWTKPGIYDFRDKPPTFHSSSEKYEHEGMEQRANDELEMMWDMDEEIETAVKRVLEHLP